MFLKVWFSDGYYCEKNVSSEYDFDTLILKHGPITYLVCYVDED